MSDNVSDYIKDILRSSGDGEVFDVENGDDIISNGKDEKPKITLEGSQEQKSIHIYGAFHLRLLSSINKPPFVDLTVPEPESPAQTLKKLHLHFMKLKWASDD